MSALPQFPIRFVPKKMLGEGAFSIFPFTIGTLYSALDDVRKEIIALKVEKAGKAKRVLQLEYEILKALQGILFIICKD